MIDPKFLEQFRIESDNYTHLKDKVKTYIESRYDVSTKSPISIYSIRVGFQMMIGDIPCSALTYWLQEWGYRVEPSKGMGNGNHNVFLCHKPLLGDTDETHYKKEWKPKRKGSIVY